MIRYQGIFAMFLLCKYECFFFFFFWGGGGWFGLGWFGLVCSRLRSAAKVLYFVLILCLFCFGTVGLFGSSAAKVFHLLCVQVQSGLIWFGLIRLIS